MKTIETPVSQEYKYNGKIVNLRVDVAQLPNGKHAKREVVEHPGGVTVAALTDKNEIVLVNQFRYPYMVEMLEIPAGKLEKGEAPLRSGVRELKEETGVVAGRYYDLGKFFPTPGYCAEVIHLYAATQTEFLQQELDEDEFINVEIIPLEKTVDMILCGEIRDGKTQAAVLKLDALLKSGRLSEFEIKDFETLI